MLPVRGLMYCYPLGDYTRVIGGVLVRRYALREARRRLWLNGRQAPRHVGYSVMRSRGHEPDFDSEVTYPCACHEQSSPLLSECVANVIRNCVDQKSSGDVPCREHGRPDRAGYRPFNSRARLRCHNSSGAESPGGKGSERASTTFRQKALADRGS